MYYIHVLAHVYTTRASMCVYYTCSDMAVMVKCLVLGGGMALILRSKWKCFLHNQYCSAVKAPLWNGMVWYDSLHEVKLTSFSPPKMFQESKCCLHSQMTEIPNSACAQSCIAAAAVRAS